MKGIGKLNKALHCLSMNNYLIIFFILLSSFSSLGSSIYPTEVLNSPRYREMEIQLWPEYDLPAVWVSYTLQLAENSTYPAAIILRMPTSAEIPNYVAVGPTKDTLFEVPFERKIDGEWSFISFFSNEPIIRLEYDDPNLIIDGSYREYQHVWYKDYEVEDVYLQVQQPYGVRTINIISPFKDEYWFNDEILRYYSARLSGEAIDEKIEINLSYQKENSEVTVDRLQVKSRIPITENTPGKINWLSSFPWMIVGLICVFLIGVGVWGMGNLRIFTRNKKPKLSNEEKPARQQVQENQVELYCPQCGNRIRSKDRYCRACGSPL